MVNEKFAATEKDFEIFKEEGKKWVEFWGLKGWDIYWKYETTGGLKYCAQCYIRLEERDVTMRLSNEKLWPEQPDEENIRRSAFHEVCELLLGRLGVINRSRFVTESESTEAEHEVISILENMIFANRDKLLGD